MRGLMACIKLYENDNQPMYLSDFVSDVKPTCWNDLLGKQYDRRIFILAADKNHKEAGAHPKVIKLSAFGRRKIKTLVTPLVA